MPGLPDKIIIDDVIIRGYLKALRHVGSEIEKHGLLEEAEPLREKFTEGCYAFLAVCKEVVREGEQLINKHVVPGGKTEGERPTVESVERATREQEGLSGGKNG
jgi:hypothetical protein